MRKEIVLCGVTAAALSISLLTASVTADARRAHDPATATKVRTERTADAPKKSDFRTRINALLQETVPPAPAEGEPVFSVPRTLSAYDTAIIGTPLATEEQCVD